MTERGVAASNSRTLKVEKCKNVVTTVKPIDAHRGGGGKGVEGGMKQHPLGTLAKTSSTPPLDFQPVCIYGQTTVKPEYIDRPKTGRSSEVAVIRGNITVMFSHG